MLQSNTTALLNYDFKQLLRKWEDEINGCCRLPNFWPYASLLQQEEKIILEHLPMSLWFFLIRKLYPLISGYPTWKRNWSLHVDK